MTKSLLTFESTNMLTNSTRQLVEVKLTVYEDFSKPSEMEAIITCLKSGGSDGWYDIGLAIPAKVAHSNDIARIAEFLQDALLSMEDELKTQVAGIREDPYGLLDFLLPSNHLEEDLDEKLPL